VAVVDTAVLLEMADQVVVVQVEDHQHIMALMEHQAPEAVAVEEDILPMDIVVVVVLVS
tara:strand:- start:107 stop:283 length:177 start_codon:yes stop_codon:yes gene_type:complete